MTDGPELTILMPCLNEAETLATCIGKARKFISDNAIDAEILVADNGSTDGSIGIAEELGARVVHVPLRGYGAALSHGIDGAQGRYVIMGDADDSYDFSNLMPFVEALRGDADLVMGNRFRGGVARGAMPPLHRYLGNPVLSFLGRLFYRTGIGDFHCGLRGFSKQAIQDLRLSTTGMEFASEMVVKASLAGLRVVEVPTTLQPDGRSRPPHLRTWRDGWRHLRFLLLYSPRWLFLIPGLGLLLAGLAAMLLIGSGTVAVGGLGLDIHTLSYAGAAITLGIQMVLFAIITKLMGSQHGWLPVTRSTLWLREILTLERCLFVAAALLLCGLAISLYAVVDWAAQGFGPLDPRTTMRWVIPSVTMLAVGGEVGLSAFVFEALKQAPAGRAQP
jgi:hypothetical protein